MASEDTQDSPTTDRGTLTLDVLVLVIAVGACLLALAACAVAYYLSASV